VFGSAEAKIFGNDNQLKITTKYKVEEHGIEADQEVNKLLFQSLKQHFAADLYDKFINAYPEGIRCCTSIKSGTYCS
jgi:SecD/SecF fusion protein